MAWDETSTTLSTVRAGTVETDLSDMTSTRGVTTTFNGSIPQYNPGEGVSINVAGDLTINPEVNSLASEANRIITVVNGGILRLGEEITSTRDGSTRKTIGLAVTSILAQNSWFGGTTGSDCSIVIQNGGTLIVKGATTKFPGMYGFLAGSHVWLDGLIHYCYDYSVGDGTIDPHSGVAVVNANTFVNTGVANRLTLAGRGYIGWQVGGDIRVDDWTLIGGGEFAFAREFGSSVNTLSDTANGFFGYSAISATAPVLIDQQLANLSGNPFFSAKNIALANAGNLKSIALQSNSNGSTRGEAYITNALNGTEMTIGSDKLVSDARNWGYGSLGRDINVDIRDGLTGDTITGGAFFYRDYKTNGIEYRLNLNTHDNTADRTFIKALVNSSLASDHEVILKYVNVASGAKIGGTSNDIRGIDRSFDVTKTDSTTLTYDPTDFGAIETTDVINIYVTTADGETTTHTQFPTPDADDTVFTVPAIGETDTIAFRIKKAFNTVFDGDLRTKSGIEGEDTFDFVFWHPEYNPVFFRDFNVTDNTFGTITLSANTLPNNDYSFTTSSENTSNNVDKLYDHILQRKANDTDTTAAIAAGVEYPDKFTIAVSKNDDNLLDIGSRTFVAESGSTQYTISNSALSAHTTAFGVGTSFLGLKTTANISLNNVLLAGGMVITGATITNLPAAIGDSVLNPGDNALSGTGGHTATTDSIINANLTISGTSANVFGGVINGTFTSTGGDTDFSGSVNETGGLTTGNISLNSSTLRTVDFKPGSITNGTIIASTATNLVLDGTHDKAISRTTGTATTEAGGTLTKELTLGNGVLTTTSTLDAKETITAGNGDHVIAGLMAKKLTLGSGDHNVSATITSGGLEMDGGDATLRGIITGNVNTDGTVYTLSTFQLDGNIDASDGDSDVGGAIDGNVQLADATNRHDVSAGITGKLQMGLGTLNQVSGSVDGLVESDGTVNCTSTFVGGSTVTCTIPIGSSNVDGTIAGLVTLGSAGAGAHTVGANIGTSGAPSNLVLGLGVDHEVSGKVSGTVSTTGTFSTAETFECGSTVTANTATGDSDIKTNSAGITGNVLLGNATNGHSFPGRTDANLTMGTGDHSVDGRVGGNVLTTGTIDTGASYVGEGTLTASGSGASEVDGSSVGLVTLGNGNHIVDANITTGGLTMGTGTQSINGEVNSAVLTSGTLTTGVSSYCKSTVESTATGTVANVIAGRVGGKVTLLNGDHVISAVIESEGLAMGTGSQTLNSQSPGITGDILTSGTLTTSAVFVCVDKLESTATATNTIRGTIGKKLTLAAADHVVEATISSGGMTLGAGNHTIDTPSITGAVLLGAGTSSLDGLFVNGVTVGLGNTILAGTYQSTVTLGDGNHTVDVTSIADLLTLNNGDCTLDGSFEDITDGTGTLVLALGTTVSGTITKSGNGVANGLTVDADFDTSSTITIPNGTLEVFGISAWSGTVNGDIHFNLAATSTEFVVPAGLPNGRVLLRNLTDHITSGDQEYTGSKIVLGTFTNVSSGAKDYRIYYKPTNTFGANGIFYLITTASSSNDNSSDTTVSIVRANHPNVLTVDAELADYTGLTATLNTITSQTEGTITIAGAGTELSAPQSQGLMMRVTDDPSYLNLVANNEVTVGYILPLELDGTTIDTNRLTLTTLSASGQQLLKAVSGIGGGNLIGTFTTTSAIQSVFIAAGGTLSKAEVSDAVDDSTTGNRVKDMRGNDLLGLAPQDDDNN